MANRICASCNKPDPSRGFLIEVAHEQINHLLHERCIQIWLTFPRISSFAVRECPVCAERITSIDGVSKEEFLARYKKPALAADASATPSQKTAEVKKDEASSAE